MALTGEPAPGAGGTTFASFGFVGQDAGGAVAFQAALSDGRSGLSSATPAALVPLPGPAAAALALGLAGTAGRALRRRWRAAPPG